MYRQAGRLIPIILSMTAGQHNMGGSNIKSLPFSAVCCLFPQPMMMPLLREMPEGRAGVRAMHKAVHTTLFGRLRTPCVAGQRLANQAVNSLLIPCHPNLVVPSLLTLLHAASVQAVFLPL
eukprot:GHUV01058662.1.p1 GENE.GHUV01058662.1~~GHUV01058662.1.p1  ORF type:complete len:121 (-),score=25.26 GHUV01058662.1:253-615(-)